MFLFLCVSGLLADTTDAEDFGRKLGGLAIGTLLLAGAAKCAMIMRRPQTNTICMLSLMFVLLAWAASSMNRIFEGRPETVYRSLWIVITLLVCGLIIAAFVLGIIGLVQYARAQGRWTQGRAQAIWGLVLSSLMLMLAAVGAVLAVVDQVDGFGGTPSTQSGLKQTFSSREFNFRVVAPDSRWVNIPPKTINADATVSFRRTRPEVGWLVICELTGVGSGIDDLDMVEIVKANMLSGATDARFSELAPATVAGMEGYQLTAEARLSNQDFVYDYWVAEHKGYAYQLITWGLRGDRKHVLSSADVFREAFELIDPDGTYYAEASKRVDSLDMPTLGFTGALSEGPWVSWDDWKEDVPESSARARYGQVGAMSVATLPLNGINPTDRDLIAVLLGTLDFDYPSSEVRDAGRIEMDGAGGFSFNARRKNDNTDGIFQLHMLRNEHRAYLLAGWVVQDSEEYIEAIRSSLDGFRFTTPTAARAIGKHEAEHEASLLNQLGLRAFNDGRYELAEDAFRSAAKSDPNTYIYIDNTINAMDGLGRHTEAIEFAEQYLPQFPDEAALKANYAYQLGKFEDRYADAVEAYSEAFNSDYDNEYYFNDYIQTFRALDRPEEGLEALDRFVGIHEGRHYPLVRAQLLRDLARYDEAVEVIKAAIGDGPLDESLLIELASIHLVADQDRQAITVTEELIEAGFGTADVYYLKGNAEAGLSWFRRAKTSLTKAYALDGDADTKAYLDYVAGVLGEGDNTLVRNPIEPVPIPKTILDAVVATEALPWEAPETADAYDLSSSVGYQFNDGEPLRKTKRRVVKIINQAGVERFSTVSFDFDAQAETLYVNYVRVRDADGEVLAEADLESYYVVDTDQDEMGTDDKTLMIPVPGLAPGCELSYEVTIEDKTETESFPFERYYMLAGQPRRYWMAYVTGRIDDISYQETGGLKPVRGTDTLGWIMHDPPLYIWESSQPRLHRWHDTLTLNAVSDDWPTLGRAYLEMIEKRLDVPKDVADLAAARIDPSAADEQKTAALATYVRDTLSYTALEFGTRGTMPSPTDQVLTNKYGDCKDHALLLWQLLKASDVKAHLALVNTDGDLVHGLPSLDQFDHMVVFVPGVAGGQMIDCTSKNSPVVGALPPGLTDLSIFVLDQDEPRFEQTTTGSSKDSLIQSSTDIRITADGGVQVDQTLTITGWHAVYMRNYLEPDRPENQIRNVESLLQSYESLRLKSFKASNVEDPTQPLVINLTYDIDGVFDSIDDMLIGRLPALWERYFLEPSAMASRTTPFELTDPLTFVSEVRVTPPDGWRLGKARPKQALDSPFLTHRFSERIEAGQLATETNVAYLLGRHEPETYDAYVKAAAQAIKSMRGPIRLTR